MLVLEPLEAARARGARIWGEVLGFGMSSDAGHITQPCAEGAARAMRLALEDAQLAPEAIGYVNAHGTGTAANDVTETQAIRAVFGGHADALPVSSTKAMHGHALGAAGALEAAATLLALHHGVLPPTVNYRGARPAVRARRRPQPGASGFGPVRALQLLRVRRHERGAGARGAPLSRSSAASSPSPAGSGGPGTPLRRGWRPPPPSRAPAGPRHDLGEHPSLAGFREQPLRDLGIGAQVVVGQGGEKRLQALGRDR